MKASVLLLATACNQIFGIDHTRHSDGSVPFFDGKPDAPFACPTLGGTPMFQRGLFQAFQQPCEGYSVSSKGSDEHAMANCYDTKGMVVEYGPRDSPLTPQIVPAAAPSTTLSYARLAPDDGEAIFGIDDSSAMPIRTRFVLHQRQGDGSWQPLGEIGAVMNPNLSVYTNYVSTPTRSTPRHAIAYDLIQGAFIELVEGDGTTYPWTSTLLQTLDSTWPSPQGELSLTPDGLALVFYASSGTAEGIYYADRSALLQPFNTPRWLMDLPHTFATDPFLTDHCARLYLSGLDSIFFAVQ
jgi:hypothetical protein